VTAFQLLGGHPWLAASLAVSTSIALMHLTKTLHPPGGATALIAVIGSDGIHSLGYLYVLVPVALGAGVMLVIALIVNNLAKTRRYPEFWL
jgi:CBS-domain-containing membrane protein